VPVDEREAMTGGNAVAFFHLDHAPTAS